jgi:circadian clock protein KaiC
MMGGQGYYRGSSVLVSGSAGTGKTSLASAFADACCRRGEKCLFFAFEESESQIVRNMRSIGIDLAPHIAAGTLKISPVRPTMYGLEMHLAVMMKMIRQFGPDAVIIDPISNLQAVSNVSDTRSMITRMIDSLKAGHITAVLTELDLPPDRMKRSSTEISSLIDTWIMLIGLEGHGERNRGLYVLKSRGMAHSNQIREFRLSSEGISLNDVYLGEGRLLTGTARYMQETRDREEFARETESRRIQKTQLESQVHILNAKIDSLRAEADAKAFEISQLAARDKERGEIATSMNKEVSALRKADPSGGNK